VNRYRARDLLLVPSLLSLMRLPLAASFPYLVDRPWAALAVLAAAGVSDVLDGWYARRHAQTTAMGAVVDPIADKTFVSVVVLTLLARGDLSLPEAALLAAREIGEAPLVAWVALRARRAPPVAPPAGREDASAPRANVPGKLATAMQFATVAAALFGAPLRLELALATGVLGAIAAVRYWQRELGPTPSAMS
jgi:CDP-diacylglycerol--glycerol-3-phosphate 3-phosphatidyltransferase/cardiolipin synthase